MNDDEVPEPPPMPDLPSDEQALSEEQAFVEIYSNDQFPPTDVTTGGARLLSIKAAVPPFIRFDIPETRYPATDELILCEGDSWFRHPFLVDIPECLMRMKYSVYNSNQPGRTLAESYAVMQSYVPNIPETRKQKFKALLISGGGNDIIDWHRSHPSIFRNGDRSKNADDYINDSQVDSVLNLLERTFEGIKQLLRSNGLSHLKVFVHCYDWITPRHGGANGFKKFLPGGGPWIDGQLDAVCSGPRDQALRNEIVHRLQEIWQHRYKQIFHDLQWTYVDLAGVVAGQWHDEIHPSNHGFWDVASKFWTALHKADITPSR